ncbi:flavin reductase family protein [Novosphingobium profundi]|uniref:flavin reductase family protein n=1 Tax=Novosphingobium profundi TaxID=1774954 RepID=UPI001BDB530D|nr:flavin reductase family protein [Novosphingobium profundi]MBT0668735.1 flavin reductase family protein [Novosphingobium profundi]
MPAQNALPDTFADWPASHARQVLEPGPVVLLTTRHEGRDNVMTLGWHQVLDFSPSRISCMVSAGNHSFAALRASGTCAINVPEADLLDTLVGIGNCSGAEVDKFARFKLAKAEAREIDVPVLPQCAAILECRLHDARMVEDYNLFILEVVRLCVRVDPAEATFVHFIGDGRFRLTGESVARRALFRPDMLGI